MLHREPSELQRSLERANDRRTLPLALGLPAPEMFPNRELGEAASIVLPDRPQALQYGFPESGLKKHIVELMRRRGVICAEDEIFITSGAQQALSLLAQLFLSEAGSSVAWEDVVYPGLRQAIDPFAPRRIRVQKDVSGCFDFSNVVASLDRYRRPAFFYTMSVGHNPLSLDMTAQQQRALVGVARELELPIIEDDVYGFLQYDGAQYPPLKALDSDNVFYVGSFSKIVSPALRVGWIAAPTKVMRTLAVLKEGSDINTATLSQRILCSYLDSCSLADRIESLRDHYRKRRDKMEMALRRHFRFPVQWRRPSSGFFFWVESEVFEDTEALLEKTLARGSSFVPGRAFATAQTSPYNTAMRLSFSSCPIELIDEAVQKVAAACEEMSSRRYFSTHP